VEFCQQNNIQIQAYAPLARAMRFRNPTIQALSRKYGCTPAQLMVKWSLQKGYVALPKSVKRERIVENASVGGFVIEQADVEKMDALDEGLVTGGFSVFFYFCGGGGGGGGAVGWGE
jgi:diketogulonate reductase-like aldo/keto reductase